MPSNEHEYRFEVKFNNDEKTKKLLELIYKSNSSLNDSRLTGVEDEDINNALRDAIDKMIADGILQQFGDNSADLNGKIDFRNKKGEELKEAISKIQTISKSERQKMMIAASQEGDYLTNDASLVEALKSVGIVLDLKDNNPNREAIEGNAEVLEESASSEDSIAKKEGEEIKKFAPEESDQEEDKQKIEELTQGVEEKEEKENIIKQYYETRYYLTGERVLEKIKETSRYKSMSPEMRQHIDDAYLSCSDPNDLLDKNFLNKKMAGYLKVTGEIQGFEDIHMSALGNTYVGYNVQEVGKQEDMDGKIDESMLVFPDFIDDMPESLKAEATRRAREYIEKRVEEVINNTDNPHVAESRLLATEEFTEENINRLIDNLGDSKEDTCMKVYLEKIKSSLAQDTAAIVNSHKAELEEAKENYDERMKKIEMAVGGAIVGATVGTAVADGLDPKSQLKGLAFNGGLGGKDLDEIGDNLKEDIDISTYEPGIGMPGIN